MSINIIPRIEFSNLILKNKKIDIFSININYIKKIYEETDIHGRSIFCIDDWHISLNAKEECFSLITSINRLITEYKAYNEIKFKIVDNDKSITEIPLKDIVSINVTTDEVEKNKKFFIVIHCKEQKYTFNSEVPDFKTAKQITESMRESLKIWNKYISCFDLNSLAFVSKSLDYYVNTFIEKK